MPPKKKTVTLDSDVDSDENDDQNQNDSDPDLDQTSQDNDDSDVDSDEVQSSQGDENDENKDHQGSGSEDDNVSDSGLFRASDNQSSANNIENHENNTDDEESDDSTSQRQPLESGNYDEDSNDSGSGSDSVSGSDSDDPHKVNYLQKLRQDATIDHLKSVHHELQHHNYQEVSVRTQIERNDDGIIIDPYHRTPPFLSKYEKARILGIRTTQLNHGHIPMVQTRNADNALIALEEYRQKKIPFIIRRPLPNGTSEYWKFTDLEQL